MMNLEDIQDQSSFQAEQELLQNPPGIVTSKPDVKKPISPVQKIIILVFSIFLFILVSLIIYRIFFFTPIANTPITTPTPTPTNNTQSTELDKQLKNIKDQVNLSNPGNQIILPPPVDMDLSF